MPTTAQAGVLAAVVFVVYLVLDLTAWLDTGAGRVLDILLFPALGFVYVPLAARAAARSRGRVRVAWTVMTVGLASWAVGEVLTAYYSLTAEEVPFPSWADAAYLFYVPCVAAGLTLFPGAKGWRDQGRMVLDGVLVTVSFFLILWLAVIRTVWQGESGTGLDFAVTLAYPAGDILILTVGVLVLIRTTSEFRPPLTLLIAGLVGAALADIVWAYEANAPEGSPVVLSQILYVGNACLIIVALVDAQRTRPSAVEVDTIVGRLALWLPLLPVAAAAVFVASAHSGAVLEATVVVAGTVLIVATLVRQLLESADLIRREDEVRSLADRLSRELESASLYVASVLPGDDMAGPVSVCSRYLPSRAMGGDSFGYTWIDDDHLVVYLVDVSGHGVKPALLSISVHNLLRSHSLSTATELQPESLTAELNSRFSMEDHDGHYFTIWYGVYQPSSGLLRYVSAGHPPALVFAEEGGAIQTVRLGGSSIPVGMFGDSEFAVECYSVPPGSQILVYSDGVLGEPPELERLEALCRAELATGVPCWLDSLTARLPDSDDDRSLILLRFQGGASSVSGEAEATSAQ